MAGDPLLAVPNPNRRIGAGEWYPQNSWYILPILAIAVEDDVGAEPSSQAAGLTEKTRA